MLVDVLRILGGGIGRRYREARLWRDMRSKYPHVELQRGAVVSGHCTFGSGVRVWSGTKIQDAKIGPYTYFASNSEISRCEIGSFCSIGPYVHITLGRHPTRDYVSTYPSFYSSNSAGRASFSSVTDFKEYLPVSIGSDVLISSHCLILDGVTIGDGAIIGAGAVVTKDIPAYAIACGVPAKVVRYRFSEDQIDFLKRLKWFERDFEWIKAHAPLFHDIELLIKTIGKVEGNTAIGSARSAG